jgi:hypothetical protein
MRTLFNFLLISFFCITHKSQGQDNAQIFDNCSIEEKGDPFDGFYYSLVVQNTESPKVSLVGFYSDFEGSWEGPVLFAMRLAFLDNESSILKESFKMSQNQKKSLQIDLKSEYKGELVNEEWKLVSNQGINQDSYLDIDKIGGGTFNSEMSDGIMDFNVFNAATFATSNRIYISLMYSHAPREVFKFNLEGCQKALATMK